MKKYVRIMASALGCFYITTFMIVGHATANFDCTPYTQIGPTASMPYSQGCGATQSHQPSTLYKTEIRRIAWPDGHFSDVTASSTGECILIHPNCHVDIDLGFCTQQNYNNPSSYCYRIPWECWPEFFLPYYFSNGHYEQPLYRNTAPVTTQGCGFPYWDHKDLYGQQFCHRGSSDDTEGTIRDHTCSGGDVCGLCDLEDNIENQIACETCSGIWYGITGCCYCEECTPIIVDVQGNGFNLTSASGGVTFDIDNDGSQEQVSWTSAGSDDAFLVLDRDGNGTINNGAELFGSVAPQPLTPDKNGFLALAEYDKSLNGGNNDGRITSSDAIFSSLRLWQDVNHNGISELSELFTLSALNVISLDLDYKEAKRTDEHKNWFRYRAKVRDGQGVSVGRWAWDVYLTRH